MYRFDERHEKESSLNTHNDIEKNSGENSTHTVTYAQRAMLPRLFYASFTATLNYLCS